MMIRAASIRRRLEPAALAEIHVSKKGNGFQAKHIGVPGISGARQYVFKDPNDLGAHIAATAKKWVKKAGAQGVSF